MHYVTWLGLWLKVKCLNREEFVVVGWTDPEGARPWLGALLLAYYDHDGWLVYAGRAGTGIGYAELERLWRRLQSLATPKMPLDLPPPRDSRFGSPLILSRVHWVRPELVAEVKYLTWTEDNLLRQGCVSRSARGQAGAGGAPPGAASKPCWISEEQNSAARICQVPISRARTSSKRLLDGANLAEAFLTGGQFLNCAQLVVTRNWQAAFHDETLGCGASIPDKQLSE